MIPKRKFTEIAALRESGDVSKLHDLTGLSKSALFGILKTGKCSTEVASSILKFYEVRKAERKALEKLLNDQN